jgi:hypothetical protein
MTAYYGRFVLLLCFEIFLLSIAFVLFLCFEIFVLSIVSVLLLCFEIFLLNIEISISPCSVFNIYLCCILVADA